MENQLPSKTPRAFFPLFVLASSFLFSGCALSDLTQTTCNFSGGDPHCSQEAAVQSDDVANCDNVAQKEEFKKVGSNPPRDKCVVMVAANTEDPAKCDNIKGGIMSYSKEDCIKGVADTARNPDTCPKLGNANLASCYNNVAQKAFDDVEKLKSMKSRDPKDVAEVQANLEKLRKTNEMLTNVNKTLLDGQLSVVRNLR